VEEMDIHQLLERTIKIRVHICGKDQRRIKKNKNHKRMVSEVSNMGMDT
jgi:hypothetical protein